MHADLILQVLLLLAVANGTPVVVKKVLGKSLACPLDGGTTFLDGRPLLGPAKTIRGVVTSILATSVCAPLLGVTWTTGAIVGIAAMAGDALSSFIKRRLGLASSSRASGLDQIPESLLPALASKNLLGLTFADIIAVVASFVIGEVVLARLLFRMHIRDEPY
jgi:CDP-2,3-bis-(O-geranylgeranyl)-sn-glycerol synthase